jgi:hypothetical protein
MDMEEFTSDLPSDTECDRCGAKITGLDWHVGRYNTMEWMAVCIAQCGKCKCARVAAAGSSEDAHKEAQKLRAKLLYEMNKADR